MRAAPVVLFAYNRVDHLRRTLAALAANPLARKTPLIVFSDAPKTPGHATAVAHVRALLRTITGFAEVRIVERQHNLGLVQSIETGVASVCAEHGRVIVLEDDIVVAPSFLAFMNEALERYVGETRVMQVSGYMYPLESAGPGDALWLPTISCWGWATWQRAWENYDPKMTGYERLRRDPALCARFNLNGAYDYLGMLERERAGALDSWGIRWHLTVFMRDGLVLYPRTSLVQNIGADGSGVHGRGATALHPGVAGQRSPEGPFVLPDRIEPDTDAMRLLERFLKSMQPGLLRRVLTWLPLRRT